MFENWGLTIDVFCFIEIDLSKPTTTKNGNNASEKQRMWSIAKYKCPWTYKETFYLKDNLPKRMANQ